MAALLFAGGCSKEDKTASTTPTEENCFVGNSVRDGEIIEGQYIIAYNNNSSEIPTAASGRTVSVQRVEDYAEVLLERNDISASAIKGAFSGGLKGVVARLTKSELQTLRNDPSVGQIEPDRIIALGACFEVVEPRTITWNIQKVGYGNGIGKTAWIMDTGIDFDHPDLTVDVARSKSFITNVTSADDENGHGTHVAGIIGAKNNTFGVLGVASGATLVSLRVLNKDGEGTLGSILQALSYVNANAKAGDVLNMSIGEEEVSEILDQQVKNTAARGILIAIAAGNDSKPAIQFSPGRANAANVYTVSAVDSLGNFASFSNYGNDVVDFAAPGVRILSTYSEGRYARMSGTSMAAPHLAGLLLLNGNNIRSSGTALNDPDGVADAIAQK